MKHSNMSKFAAGAVTATMVATAVVPTAAASFTDIGKLGAGVQAEVVKAVELGFFNDAPLFNPGNQITRGQAALTLARYLSGDEGAKAYALKHQLDSKVTPFADIPVRYKDGNAYQQELFYSSLILKHAGAFTQAQLTPGGQLTRAQMAKIIVQTFELQKKDGFVSPITDIQHLHPETRGYIETIASYGITNVTKFRPTETVTRAQMASFLVRSYETVHEADKVIAAVGDVKAISLFADEKIELPKTVTVTYEDASKADVAVKWNTTGIDFTKVGTYDLKGEIANTKLTASLKVEVKAVQPEVRKVEALNAAQLQITFSTPVQKSSLLDDNGNVLPQVLKVESLDKQPVAGWKGQLSKDGKQLIVTTTTPLKGRYDVTIDQVKTQDGKVVPRFVEKTFTVQEDKVAPTIVGGEQLSAGEVKVNFSEPVKGGTITFTYANGQPVPAGAITHSVLNGQTDVILTMNSSVLSNQKVVATFVGVQDMNGNFISPNPSTYTFQRGSKDGVAPTAKAIQQTGAKTFTIQFSEAVEALKKEEIKVEDQQVTGVVPVGTDHTTYEVTVKNVLNGTTRVTIPKVMDLSGEEGKVDQLVAFQLDQTAPKVADTKIVKEKDGLEYIVFTFDKEIVATNAKVQATGKHVKNFITTAVNGRATALTVDADQKTVRVALKDVLATVDVEQAAYELTFAFTNVKSVANQAAVPVTFNFVRGKDTGVASTAVAKVTSVTQTQDRVTVNFDQKVEGASATNAQNYRLGNAVVEKVELQPSETQVVIYLKENTITATGNYEVAISSIVTKESGLVMEPYTQGMNLVENIRPIVQEAKAQFDQSVIVTFSEAVEFAENAPIFDVIVEGKSVGQASLQPTTQPFTYQLSVKVTPEQIQKGVALKVLQPSAVTDTNKNPLTAGTVIPVTK